ncbi:MAG: hypothetical protein HOI53_03615 [Francisellaceae bacterium]|mgnify:CR=1 FL=1|nr:hypothetical protein [Francisellaceae bacterium]MBT6207089.1 hypothetical protein [Francisellaceae bacterium]MBT6538975.1 hypothetical protein [Francisellaceae bacterium]
MLSFKEAYENYEHNLMLAMSLHGKLHKLLQMIKRDIPGILIAIEKNFPDSAYEKTNLYKRTASVSRSLKKSESILNGTEGLSDEDSIKNIANECMAYAQHIRFYFRFIESLTTIAQETQYSDTVRTNILMLNSSINTQNAPILKPKNSATYEQFTSQIISATSAHSHSSSSIKDEAPKGPIILQLSDSVQRSIRKKVSMPAPKRSERILMKKKITPQQRPGKKAKLSKI